MIICSVIVKHIFYKIGIFRPQQYCSQEICSGLHYDEDIYEELNDDRKTLIHPYTIIIWTHTYIYLMLTILMVLLMIAVRIGKSRLALKKPARVGISAPINLDKMGLNLTLMIIICIAIPLRVYLNK